MQNKLIRFGLNIIINSDGRIGVFEHVEIAELITGNDHSSLAQIKVRLNIQRIEVYLWNVVFFRSLID